MAAEEVLREAARRPVDEQEEWFRDQVANLPADPAEAAARLTELSARADELNAEWQGRDATFVGPDGQGNTGAEYFAQTYFRQPVRRSI